MKSLAFLCLVSLALMSCVSSRIHEDSFVSLHNRVAQILAGRCEVTPVATDAILGRSFEAKPPSSGCRIVVFEREFLSQREWDRRYAAGTNSLSEFMTTSKANQQIDARTTRRFADMERLLRLPNWRFECLGVHADVHCPEVVYPDMEKDSTAAQHLLEEITSLLTPYHRPPMRVHE
jgi:hypothetical protein